MSRQVVLKEVNAHLICVLCGGYFIDATTIVECIHSFCRSCIVKHLENSLYCPICEVMVDKSKPLNNLRADPLLQNIVNKIVPDLMQSEVKRKAKFYEDSPRSKEVDDVIYMYRMVNNNSEAICVSICNCQEPTKKWELRCPSAMPLKHLKKLVIGKFGLECKRVVVEFLLEYQRLREDLTLLQISYLDSNRTSTDTLNLMYSILKIEKTPKIDCNHVESAIADSGPAVDKEIQLAITEGGVMSLSVNCDQSLDEVIASSNGSCFTEQPSSIIDQPSCNTAEPTCSNDKSKCETVQPEPEKALDLSPKALQIVELPKPSPVSDKVTPTPVLDKSVSDKPELTPITDNPVSSSVTVIPASNLSESKSTPVSDKSKSQSISAESTLTPVLPKSIPTHISVKSISTPALAQSVSTPALVNSISTPALAKSSHSIPVSARSVSSSVSDKPASTAISHKPASTSTPTSHKPLVTPVTVSIPHSAKSLSTPLANTVSEKPSSSADTEKADVSLKKEKLKGVNGEMKRLTVDLPRIKVNENSNEKSKTPTSSRRSWSPKQQRLRPRLMTKSDDCKASKIRRTMPRFLGNPASGVKPMYNNNHISEESLPSTSASSTPTNHSALRIDPKTLRPFGKLAKEPTSAPLATSPFIPRNKTIILPDPMLTPYNPMSLPPALHSSLPPTVSLPYRNQRHNSREDFSKT